MTDFNATSAVYALNSYTWKLLEANLGWKKHDGMVPIIPLAQQPELMEAGTSFIVYGASRPSAQHLYALERQTVVYNIFSESSTTADKVAELLYQAFMRQDDAAADVNDHLANEVEKGKRAKHRGVHFATIRSYAVQDQEPSEYEGGYSKISVVVEMVFTRDDTGIKTTDFDY